MFKNINKSAVVKSFFLGILIGFIIQFFGIGFDSFGLLILSIFISGIIGLFIGFVTEWITSFLPISLANPRMFFIINSIIALTVAGSIFIIGKPFFYAKVGSMEFCFMISFILVAIAFANILDYLNYRRINKKLLYLQKKH